MLTGNSEPGFLLLDKSLGPVASNHEAIRILTYPNLPERIKRIDVFLGDKIRAGLVSRQSLRVLDFVKEFTSGKRRYSCRSFKIDTNGKGVPLPCRTLVGAMFLGHSRSGADWTGLRVNPTRKRNSRASYPGIHQQRDCDTDGNQPEHRQGISAHRHGENGSLHPFGHSGQSYRPGWVMRAAHRNDVRSGLIHLSSLRDAAVA